MRIRTIILNLFLALALPAAAIPSRWTSLQITQPDGTVFHASFRGDAFFKLMTTDDGCAVVKNDDGFYCYAFFDADGGMASSPYRVGEPGVPAEVLAASRDIPYQTLYRNAARRRTVPEPFPGMNLNRRIQDRHPFSTRAQGTPRRGIVILVQFQDVRFETPRSYFEQLLNAGDGTSAKSYFDDQFNGRFDFDFTVSEIVTVSGKQADYGKNGRTGEDVDPAGMVREACQLADSRIDFSRYDEDGDGAVDNVFLFFAGRSEADDPDKNADCIWPHTHALEAAGISLNLDGKKVSRYACASEFMRLGTGRYTTASIGTFCHEYTHTFGLPDFYDTDGEGSGGLADGMWRSLALMDAGNYNNDGYTPPYFNAVERYILGIGEPVLLTEGNWSLEPIHRNGTYAIIPTDDEGECYLLECRSSEKWDAHIGGSGLVIYHLDRSERPAGSSTAYGSVTAWQRWNRYNEVNATPGHQCADVVEAIPGATSVVHAFWPQTGHDALTVDTDPALFLWSGGKPGVAITDIRRTDSGDVSFRFVGNATGRAPDAVLESEIVYQDAAIIQWRASDPEYEKEAFIRFGTSGRTGEEQAVLPYEPGKYAFVLEGLSPRTAYAVQLYFKAADVPGTVNENCKFTTRSHYQDSFPYIILPTEGRDAQGAYERGSRLPLRVYNAPDATGVNWYLDGRPVAPDASGYYRVSTSGTLKAEIVRTNGSRDIIIKKLVVK